MALSFIDYQMVDGFTKSHRFDPTIQRTFVEELAKENDLERFSERETGEIFYFLFYIHTLSIDSKVKETAKVCLEKFFS